MWRVEPGSGAYRLALCHWTIITSQVLEGSCEEVYLCIILRISIILESYKLLNKIWHFQLFIGAHLIIETCPALLSSLETVIGNRREFR